MRPCLFISLALFLIGPACWAQKVENGITEELAAWRKQEISNIRYQLHYQIPASTQNITAQEVIYFDLSQNDRQLQIDFKTDPKQIRSLMVNGKELEPVLINEHLILESGSLLKKNNEVRIDFVASGNAIKCDTSGFIYTLFVPARAREAFACFDQPDLKAVFELKLTVPDTWLAVSNGAVVNQTKNAVETTYVFEPTIPISTYLFCFATGKLKVNTETRDGRTINFYYRQTDQKKIEANMAECMDLNFKALAFNANYLDGEYPFSKFDFVEIQGFSLAGMEHPGAIYYNSNFLFLPIAIPSTLHARSLTIGHEVSHIWFGDLVTMKWFNEVWLKEVFANYLGENFAGTQAADNNARKSFLLTNLPNAYVVDRFPSSFPILNTLPNLDQAGLSYGRITYNKAPVMIHQLKLVLGEEAFRKGLQDYIRVYKGGNADFNGLMQQFQKYTSANLDEWMNAWVRKPGRPVITYKIETTNGKISQFTLFQHGEYDDKLLPPQQFDIGLYDDSSSIETIRVNLTGPTQPIQEVIGKKAPRFVLFNTSGEGYGVFPIDHAMVDEGLRQIDVLARASAIINLYELMLRSKEDEPIPFATSFHPGPKALLDILLSVISWETDAELLQVELNYLSTIYWNILNPKTRQEMSDGVEKRLLDAVQSQAAANKTPVYRMYNQLAESPEAIEALYACWDKKSLPDGISFATADWTNLAIQLALRNYRTNEIIDRQLDSLKKDPVSYHSFWFRSRALIPEAGSMDSLFQSFLLEKGRKEEPLVIASLNLLHHPLRQAHSKKYIRPSLDILAELVRTNDMTFGPDWIGATLDSYHDPEAVQILREYFSAEHPDVPDLLDQITKQHADWVFRAEKIGE